MSQTQLLQEKIAEIVAQLSKYESEMVDLKDSQPARGSGAKKAKLQKLIQGAKRRLTNAEKKLKEAPASQPASLNVQHSLDVSDVTQPAAANQVDPVQELNTDMVVDNITDNQATTPLIISAGGAEELNLSSSVAGDSITPAVDPLPISPTPSTDNQATTPLNISAGGAEELLSSSVTGGSITPVVNPLPICPTPSSPPEALNASPEDAMIVIASGAAIGPPGALKPDILASGIAAPSDPKVVQALVSENHSTSFKRVDRSESESEDKEMDLTLITIEDRRFVKGARPVKKPRYVEVSDNDELGGDPGIFDDEAEETGVTKLTGATQPTQQPGNINPTVEPESVPPHRQGTQSRGRKGKGREGDTKAQRKKESQGKVAEKGLQSGGRQMIVPKDGNSASENTEDENEKGDYQASQFSVAKATRLNNDLSKRRERWANPDVATMDYDLAIELLKNHSNNYLCIAHVMLNRKLVSHVDNLKGPVKIRGTPLPRNQNPNVKSEIPRPPGHFHCGCHEKVAVAGFVMWKTWKAKCKIEGKLVVEGLHQHKAFSPREVLFILQFMKSKFGYTVEDMFTGSFDEEEELRNEAAVMKKTSKFTAHSHFNMIGQTFSLDEDPLEFEEEDMDMEWI